MEINEHFTKDYFLFELQKADVIKNDDENDADSLTLEKVPNITIGMVLAAKSLKHFENHNILNWIRKGRKVTTLIKEQFELYDKLFIYLQSNVYTEDDINKWEQLLNETKYVFPEKKNIGWSQIFGFSPDLLEKVDPENISNPYIGQHQKKISDEDEETKQERDTQKENIDNESCKSVSSISNACFSHEYFLSLLQDVGAFIRNETERDIPTSLVKVPNITIGLVLAAKAINLFTDETILTWIRKGRKVTLIIEKQFALYKKLSDYLMNHIEIKDIEKWKLLVNARYVFPLSEDDGWALIFGEIPELCHKIDTALVSYEHLENSEKENDEKTMSCKQLDTVTLEFDEDQKSIKQLEISKSESEEEQKSYNTKIANLSGSRKSSQKDDDDCDYDKKDKDEEDNDDEDIDDESVSDDDKSNTEFSNLSDKSSSEACGNAMSSILSENRISSSELSENTIVQCEGDENKGNTELSKLPGKIIYENTVAQSQGYYLSEHDENKSDVELSNIAEKRDSSSESLENALVQSKGNESSDSDDDDLENLFDAVGAELTAAEHNNKELPIEIQSKNENDNQNLEMTMDNNNKDKETNKSKETKRNKEEEDESDDDIYDVDNLLDYEYSLDSDTELQENREDGSKTTKEDKESSLEEKKKEDALIESGIIKKSNNGIYLCLKCKYASRDVESTEKHVNQHTGGLAVKKEEKEDALIKSGIIRKSEFGTYSCLKCKYASKNLENTEEHAYNHVYNHQRNFLLGQTPVSREENPVSREENPVSRVVHITNILKEVTNEEIVNLALPFGKVLKKIFVRQQKNQKKSAHLEMSDEMTATAMVDTLKLCPVQLCGHQVLVKYSKHKELLNDNDISLAGIKSRLQMGYLIPGLCSMWNKTGKCFEKKCIWPHRCDECGNNDHPSCRCGRRKQREKREKEKELPASRVPDEKIQNKIPGMCHMFNTNRQCRFDTKDKPCKYTHRCDQCGGDHPRTKCSIGKPRPDEESSSDSEDEERKRKFESEKTGIDSDGKKNNKRSRFESKHLESSSNRPKLIVSLKSGKQFYEMKVSRSRAGFILGQHGARITKIRKKTTATINISKKTNFKQEQVITIAGSSDEVQKALYMIDNEDSDEIPGMCSEYNNTGRCKNHKFCRLPHRCNECGGEHPKKQCTNGKQRTGIGKGDNIGLMGTSRSRSPIQQQRRWDRDESPSMQQQPASQSRWSREELPSIQYQPFSVSPPPIQYQPPSIPILPQALSRIVTSPSSTLSGVAERVAKLTLNKDTLYIIEQIKRGLENAGIPPTLETIGKLVLEVSEVHEKMKSVKRDQSVDYGHGFSSNPINNQSLSYDSGQPNWSQSSGRMSQQSTGQMYQSMSSNQSGNAWFQSSGSVDANNSGRMSQQSMEQMYQKNTSNYQQGGMPSQQNTGQIYQNMGNNQRGNTYFQGSSSSGANISVMSLQQNTGQVYQNSGINQRVNPWYQSLGNMGNTSSHQNQWNQGIQGPVPLMQIQTQAQGPPMGKMWPQGQSNVMSQSNMQDIGSYQGGGNVGSPWETNQNGCHKKKKKKIRRRRK